MTNKLRLDKYLYDNQYAESRNKAQQLILDSKVKVNNKIINKPNFLVSNDDNINIISNLEFVSRGGLKLESAIKHFQINMKDKIVLDIGASTGGFTDCCIKNGAKIVYALDVGTNQLHYSLLSNPKVINLPNTNLKKIPDIFHNLNIDIFVVDVSFISLKNVFEVLMPIFKKEQILICLIKPQFELNKAIITKNKGCIKSPKLHNQAINNVLKSANEYNFKLVNIIESPIKGAKGENKEFLAMFKIF